mgnify:CR=1 FL=1
MAKEKLHCKVTLVSWGISGLLAPAWQNCWTVSAATVPCRGQPGKWRCRTPRPGRSCVMPRPSGGFPLIRRYVGGKDGGRSVLTRQAEIILARYEQMDEALHAMADRQFQQWFNDDELQKLQTMEG